MSLLRMLTKFYHEEIRINTHVYVIFTVLYILILVTFYVRSVILPELYMYAQISKALHIFHCILHDLPKI